MDGREYCFTAESPSSPREYAVDGDDEDNNEEDLAATLNDFGAPISPIVSEDSVSKLATANISFPLNMEEYGMHRTTWQSSMIAKFGSEVDSSSSDGEIDAKIYTSKLSARSLDTSHDDWVCAWGLAWGHNTSVQEQKRFEKRKTLKSKGDQGLGGRRFTRSNATDSQMKSASDHQKDRIKTIKSQLRKQIHDTSISLDVSDMKTPRSIRSAAA